MPRGRILPALFLFCFVTQLVAVARVRMPSQDGLKFIEIAREFNYQPAWDVVRSADQHPLYPFLVNRVAAFLRFSPFTSPDLWRISAQLVSVAASLAALWPIFAISRRFAGESACLIAVFVWLLLPLPVALGHETLSDALALCFGLWALEFGLQAAESRVPRFRIYFAAGSAMAVAAAYLTRPEGLLVGLSIPLFWFVSLLFADRNSPENPAWSSWLAAAVYCLIVTSSVIGYLWVNGSITDRLMSMAGAVHPTNMAISPVLKSNLPKGLPQALQDPSLDFSPKDISREVRETGLGPGLWRMLVAWSEGLGIFLAVLCLSGIFRATVNDRRANWLIRIHLALLLAVLTYQSVVRGYLSERHMLMVLCLSLPFVASGLMLAHSDISRWTRLSPVASRRFAQAGLGLLLLTGIFIQTKPEHASRLPHYQAGQWLAKNAPKSAAVFDTRGWASFEADRRRYDPYHIAQALSDQSTGFFVVERTELESGSGRAKTYTRIINEGGSPAAQFQRKQGQHSPGDVLVFQWSRPLAWNDSETGQKLADSIPTPLRDDKIRPVDHRPVQEERRR